jgi:hypothetical protein
MMRKNVAAYRWRDHPDQQGHAVRGEFLDDDDRLGHAASATAVFLRQVQTEQSGGTEVFPQFLDAFAGAAALQEVPGPVAVGDPGHAIADSLVLDGVVDKSNHVLPSGEVRFALCREGGDRLGGISGVPGGLDRFGLGRQLHGQVVVP